MSIGGNRRILTGFGAALLALFMTQHAEARKVGRGIPQFAIDCLLEFGEVEFHRGCEIHRLSKKGEKKMRSYMGVFSSEAKRLYDRNGGG